MITKKKGFTLVELIVVIAIIAILIAVTIPSFTRYVDQSRFSNDVSKAASMTTVIKAHFVGDDADGYSAYDIKELINDLNGSDIDFTPEAVNTGFFWIPEQLKVVALKYEDAQSYFDTELTLVTRTLLLDYHLDASYASPEELFGTGMKLMTRDGSAVALAVNLVYELASSGSLMDAVYTKGFDSIDDYADSLFARFAGIGISTELKTSVLAMLDAYDPLTTIFVNNVEWSTLSGSAENIVNVVFAEGVSNIPAFDLSFSDINELQLGSVTLPRSVKTIEAGAFLAGSVTNLQLQPGSTVSVIGEDTSGLLNQLGTTVDQMEIGSGLNLITYDPDSPYSFDLTNLLDYFENVLNIVVTGYRIDVDLTVKSKSRVHVYTADGYIGYVIPVSSD